MDRDERMNDFLFVSVSDADEVLEEYFLSGLSFFLLCPVVSRSSTQLGYSLPSPDTQLGYSVLPSGRERFFIVPAIGGDLNDALLE